MSDQPQNQPAAPPESATDLGARLLRRSSWGERVLSPWLQRQMQPEPATRPTSLTVGHTAHLLARLQRAADESLIWRPDVGSLNPHQIEQFTTPIVARFPAHEEKYQPETREPHTNTTGLPLAGGPGRSEPGAEAEAETVVETGPPAPPFTMEQVKQALQNRSWSDWGETAAPAAPATLPPAPTPVQRQAAPKSAGNRPMPFSVAEVRAALEQPHFTKPAATGRSTTPPPVQRQPSTQTPSGSAQSAHPRPRPRSRVEEILPSQASEPGSTSSEPSPEVVQRHSGPEPASVVEAPPAKRPTAPTQPALEPDPSVASLGQMVQPVQKEEVEAEPETLPTSQESFTSDALPEAEMPAPAALPPTQTEPPLGQAAPTSEAVDHRPEPKPDSRPASRPVESPQLQRFVEPEAKAEIEYSPVEPIADTELQWPASSEAKAEIEHSPVEPIADTELQWPASSGPKAEPAKSISPETSKPTGQSPHPPEVEPSDDTRLEIPGPARLDRPALQRVTTETNEMTTGDGEPSPPSSPVTPPTSPAIEAAARAVEMPSDEPSATSAVSLPEQILPSAEKETTPSSVGVDEEPAAPPALPDVLQTKPVPPAAARQIESSRPEKLPTTPDRASQPEKPAESSQQAAPLLEKPLSSLPAESLPSAPEIAPQQKIGESPVIEKIQTRPVSTPELDELPSAQPSPVLPAPVQPEGPVASPPQSASPHLATNEPDAPSQPLDEVDSKTSLPLRSPKSSSMPPAAQPPVTKIQRQPLSEEEILEVGEPALIEPHQPFGDTENEGSSFQAPDEEMLPEVVPPEIESEERDAPLTPTPPLTETTAAVEMPLRSARPAVPPLQRASESEMKTVQQPSPQPSAAPSRDDTSLQGKVNQVPPSSPTAPTLDDTSPYGEIKQAPLPLPAGETSPSREVPAMPGETIRASEARLGFPELPQVKAMSENQPLQRTTFKVETETLSPPLPESEDRAFPPDPAIAPRQEIAPSSDLLPQPDLNREVLARTKAGTSLPLTRPFRPLQRKPADESEPPSETSLPPGWQTEETAAAEHVDTEVNAENPPEPAAHPQPLRRPQALSPLARSPEETALPLAVPKEITRPDRQQGPFSARPSLSEAIQRQPVVHEAVVLQPPRPVVASHESPVVQRALHDEDSPPVAVTTEASQEEQAVDLDALARQIFPRVKRMLAVERERRPFR